MPDIPKTQVGLIQHTRATTPLTTQAQLKYYDDGSAEGWAKLGRAFNAGVSALADFQRKSEETENNLSAAEARNYFTKLNSDLTQRMAENPGAYNDFKKWAEETDKQYAEGAKQYLDRMTPEFRKQFEVNMQHLRMTSLDQRIRTGTQAKVTADYNRFQTLFKEYAATDPEQAEQLLLQHQGKLISEQEFKTKMEIDLPRIYQSAQVRRQIDAGTPGIIEALEQTDKDGNPLKFTHLTPDHRRGLINYAKAKDSRKRLDENTVLLDQLNSGKIITTKDVEASFAGRTTPEDLRQKHEQMKMVRVFESNRERATTAANKAALDRRINADELRIYTYNFSPNETQAEQQYTDLKRELLVAYSGDMATFDKLAKRLDAAYQSSRVPKTSYKNSSLFKEGEKILAGFKAQGMFVAGVKGFWGVNEKEDVRPSTATYVEKNMENDLANFVQDNPNATYDDLRKALTDRLSLYNKSTVGQIAEMVMNNGKSRFGRTSVTARTSQPREGSTGTFNGKKVVFKKGKWQYAE